MGWFNTTEGFAIWLEAIALILIFIWDRLDSRADHKQTIAQLRIAQEQAAASQAMAQSTINAERAWVLGYLGGNAAGQIHVVRVSGSTTTRIMLTCKNEGRTPAWIDSIYAHMEIIAKDSDVVGPGNRKDGRLFGVMGPLGPEKKGIRSVIGDSRVFGVMGPLGAEKRGMRQLEVTCLGQLDEGDALSIYVLILYRDIFNITRETHLGYTLFENHDIYQQDSTERNRNT